MTNKREKCEFFSPSDSHRPGPVTFWRSIVYRMRVTLVMQSVRLVTDTGPDLHLFVFPRVPTFHHSLVVTQARVLLGPLKISLISGSLSVILSPDDLDPGTQSGSQLTTESGYKSIFLICNHISWEILAPPQPPERQIGWLITRTSPKVGSGKLNHCA